VPVCRANSPAWSLAIRGRLDAVCGIIGAGRSVHGSRFKAVDKSVRETQPQFTKATKESSHHIGNKHNYLMILPPSQVSSPGDESWRFSYRLYFIDVFLPDLRVVNAGEFR
jgi:hypothetical protein